MSTAVSLIDQFYRSIPKRVKLYTPLTHHVEPNICMFCQKGEYIENVDAESDYLDLRVERGGNNDIHVVQSVDRRRDSPATYHHCSGCRSNVEWSKASECIDRLSLPQCQLHDMVIRAYSGYDDKYVEWNIDEIRLSRNRYPGEIIYGLYRDLPKRKRLTRDVRLADLILQNSTILETLINHLENMNNGNAIVDTENKENLFNKPVNNQYNNLSKKLSNNKIPVHYPREIIKIFQRAAAKLSVE